MSWPAAQAGRRCRNRGDLGWIIIETGIFKGAVRRESAKKLEDGGGAGLDVEFFITVLEVGENGVHGDAEFVVDFFVVTTFRKQFEDFLVRGGESERP